MINWDAKLTVVHASACSVNRVTGTSTICVWHVRICTVLNARLMFRAAKAAPIIMDCSHQPAFDVAKLTASTAMETTLCAKNAKMDTF